LGPPGVLAGKLCLKMTLALGAASLNVPNGLPHRGWSLPCKAGRWAGRGFGPPREGICRQLGGGFSRSQPASGPWVRKKIGRLSMQKSLPTRPAALKSSLLIQKFLAPRLPALLAFLRFSGPLKPPRCNHPQKLGVVDITRKGLRPARSLVVGPLTAQPHLSWAFPPYISRS